MRVYSHEFNIPLENAAWFPLSTGCLQAYALTHSEIKSNYEFMPCRFVKRPLSQLESYDRPGIAAFSTYMWNRQMNLQVAARLKEEHPDCLVVFGGPDVPYDPSFLEKHPFIDVAVYGEGEQTFTSLLLRYLGTSDFADIPSISYRKDGRVIKNNGEPPFVRDLDVYPSPYLSGGFDYLLGGDTKFQAIVETNRGCPFRCTFCFWGQGTMKMGKKYRFFSLDRVQEIAEWFGQHDIEYIFCADSNFGIHKRDMEVAKSFVGVKKKYGKPEKLRVCYAKNAEENVYHIGELLHQENMEKSVTLSRQSNDPVTLTNIGRDNIKIGAFNNLAKKCTESQIPIYSELIIGLPGESYETFLAGIEEIVQQSVNVQIFIYLCSILTNTNMDLPEYREKFRIRTVNIPLTEQHCKIQDDSSVPEWDEIIVATYSMNEKEWKKTLIFSWFFQMMYSLRAGIFILLYLQFRHGQQPTKYV